MNMASTPFAWIGEFAILLRNKSAPTAGPLSNDLIRLATTPGTIFDTRDSPRCGDSIFSCYWLCSQPPNVETSYRDLDVVLDRQNIFFPSLDSIKTTHYESYTCLSYIYIILQLTP